jgi:hypothetical protein
MLKGKRSKLLNLFVAISIMVVMIVTGCTAPAQVVPPAASPTATQPTATAQTTYKCLDPRGHKPPVNLIPLTGARPTDLKGKNIWIIYYEQDPNLTPKLQDEMAKQTGANMIHWPHLTQDTSAAAQAYADSLKGKAWPYKEPKPDGFISAVGF